MINYSYLALGDSYTIGEQVPFAENFPNELEPIGLDEKKPANFIPGKNKQLTVLGDKPWNAETPIHLLAPASTPTDLFFVRNNGIPPTGKSVLVISCRCLY